MKGKRDFRTKGKRVIGPQGIRLVRGTRRVGRGVFACLLRFINTFVPKAEGTIFCEPSMAFAKDGVDLINYSADNTLTLLNHLMRSRGHGVKHVVLVNFDRAREQEIYEYFKGACPYKLSVVYPGSLRYFLLFARAVVIVSSNALQAFPYKSARQVYLSVNYYLPFKVAKRVPWSWGKADVVVSPSLLCSQIISISARIDVRKFVTLGFPRQDNISRPRLSRSQICSLVNIPTPDSKIVLYAPTYREHEKRSNRRRPLLGYKGCMDALSEVLERNDAYIIVKMHPGQNTSIITESQDPRVRIMRRDYRFNLYDIAPHADCLITDYSSIYFEVLPKGFPVVFNWYDYEDYASMRGFEFDPIEAMCVGDIVRSAEELLTAVDHRISTVYAQRDDESKHREVVQRLMYLHSDSDNCARVLGLLARLMSVDGRRNVAAVQACTTDIDGGRDVPLSSGRLENAHAFLS